MGSGPWPVILLIMAINAIGVLATGGDFTWMSIAAVVAMLASLITFVSLQGATGSDPASAGSIGFVAARAVALAVYLAAIVATAAISAIEYGGLVLAGINLALGGFAIFQAISHANSGA